MREVVYSTKKEHIEHALSLVPGSLTSKAISVRFKKVLQLNSYSFPAKMKVDWLKVLDIEKYL